MKKLLKSAVAFVAALNIAMIAASAGVPNAGTNEAPCSGGHADGNWADLEGTKITVSSETNGGGQTEGINFGWAWDKEYLNDAAINAGKYDGMYKVIDRTSFSPTGSITGAGWWLRIGYHSGVEQLESVDAEQKEPVEITIELPEVKSIGKVNLWPRAYLDSDDGKTTARPERIFFPQAFDIYTSKDGKSWNKVYSKDYGKNLYVPECGKWLAGRNQGKDNIARPTLHSYTFNNVDAKFVKIVVTRKAVDTQPNRDGTYDSAVCLSEIELYTNTQGAGNTTTGKGTTTRKADSSTTKPQQRSDSTNTSSNGGTTDSEGTDLTSEETSEQTTVSNDTSDATTGPPVSGDTDDSGNNTALIVGIIIAAVVILGGGGFGLYWFRFRKKA